MEKFFQLLKDVLLDAFNVSSIYFTPPYEDIHKIDMGMRAAVWSNYSDKNSAALLTDNTNPYRILIIKSNLGFYNILATLGNGKNPDFITIGPFRNNDLSATYFTQILKDAHITPSTIHGMKHIYEGLPYVQIDTLVNITKHILGAFIPEYKDIEAEFVEYSHEKRPFEINPEVIDHTFFAFSEQYRDLLSIFLDHIKHGDSAGSRNALSRLLREFKISPNKNMRNYKSFLQTLNDYCHMTLLDTDIHPSHILKLAFSINTRIDNVTNLSNLEQISNDLCRKYCLLVKNYASPSFSKLTKDVIAYIQLHMDEELSLKQLALHFHKNASSLSATFSKETKQTITAFIQQTRVQEAIRLFNTTHMSVSEVALTVGYQDFSYFSKIFTKIVGITPRNYRQHQF